MNQNNFDLNLYDEIVSMLGNTTKAVKKWTYFKIDGVLYQVSSTYIIGDWTIDAHIVLTTKGTFPETLQDLPRIFTKEEVQQNMVDDSVAVLMVVTAFKKLTESVKGDSQSILNLKPSERLFYDYRFMKKPSGKWDYYKSGQVPDYLLGYDFRQRELADPLIDTSVSYRKEEIFSPPKLPRKDFKKIIFNIKEWEKIVPKWSAWDNPQD